MGGLNPLAKPKMPKPVIVEPPKLDTEDNQLALQEERKRRQAASGATGNIVSSLAGATTDQQTVTRRSTLLGG